MNHGEIWVYVPFSPRSISLAQKMGFCPVKIVEISSTYCIVSTYKQNNKEISRDELMSLDEFTAKLTDSLFVQRIIECMTKTIGVDTSYTFSEFNRDNITAESYMEYFKLIKDFFHLGDGVITSFRDEKKRKLKEIQVTVLNSMYENLWDWSGNNIIIHYPEIQITNSAGHSEKIYDLYVCVQFTTSGTISDVRGIVATRSFRHYRSSYSHSHLPSGTRNSFESFCLGEGTPIRNAISNYNVGPNVDTFSMFLAVLDAYVRWESLEGGPYIRMSQINGATNNTLPICRSTDVTLTTSLVLKELETLPLLLNNEKATFYLNREDVDLLSLIDKHANVKVGILDNGTAVNINSQESKDVPDRDEGEIINFKGRRVRAIITNKHENNLPATVNMKVVALPTLKIGVLDALTAKVNPNLYIEEKTKELI